MTKDECKYQSYPGMMQIETEGPMERRRASILAADMVGYSRWMAFDEDGVIRRLRWARAKIIFPTLTKNGGRIVRIMGDGLIAEFTSPLAAMQTAISIQQALASFEVADLNEHRLEYRIGLNLGDAVVDGDDLLGDCVNVAARLESIAPVGGIYLSRAVHDKITDLIDIPMIAMGAQFLKNIPEPVEVWSVDLNGCFRHRAPLRRVIAETKQ